jgi:acetylornithine deacetylase/succinyl-diaminopimelate desuccinylase-like protein
VVEHVDDVVVAGDDEGFDLLGPDDGRLAAQALEEAFGKAPLFQRNGGSVPVVAALEKQLGLKSVLVGFASPNGNFHAPNEWMPLANYRGGMDAIVRLWDAFGGISSEELRDS